MPGFGYPFFGKITTLVFSEIYLLCLHEFLMRKKMQKKFEVMEKHWKRVFGGNGKDRLAVVWRE
jgi:hypothetical protein